jgi:hypothetical protein
MGEGLIRPFPLMLMALGLTFENSPFNPQSTDRTTSVSWVEKSVVGRRSL